MTDKKDKHIESLQNCSCPIHQAFLSLFVVALPSPLTRGARGVRDCSYRFPFVVAQFIARSYRRLHSPLTRGARGVSFTVGGISVRSSAIHCAFLPPSSFPPDKGGEGGSGLFPPACGGTKGG